MEENKKISYLGTINLLHSSLIKGISPNISLNSSSLNSSFKVQKKPINKKRELSPQEIIANEIKEKNIDGLTEKGVIDYYFQNYGVEENRTTLAICIRYLRIDLLKWMVEKYPEEIKEMTKLNTSILYSAILDIDEGVHFEEYLQWAIDTGFDINHLLVDEKLGYHNVLLKYGSNLIHLQNPSKEQINIFYNKANQLIERGFKLRDWGNESEVGEINTINKVKIEKGLIYYACKLNHDLLNELFLKQEVFLSQKECVKCLVDFSKSYMKREDLDKGLFSKEMQTFLKFLKIGSIEIQMEAYEHIKEKTDYIGNNNMNFPNEVWGRLKLEVEKMILNKNNTQKTNQKLKL